MESILLRLLKLPGRYTDAALKERLSSRGALGSKERTWRPRVAITSPYPWPEYLEGLRLDLKLQL